MVQQQITKWHDRFIKKKEFQVGDWALLFHSKFKDFKGKFTTHWLGTYEIQDVFDNGSIWIKTIDEEEASFLVNGHRLKIYNKPLNRDEFVSSFNQDEIQILGDESPTLTPLHTTNILYIFPSTSLYIFFLWNKFCVLQKHYVLCSHWMMEDSLRPSFQ